MIVELERQAAAAGDGITPIDLICEWTVEGKTLAEIARELTECTGQTISSGVLSSWVNSTKEGTAKITAARALAAHDLAEQSLTVLDELEGTEVTKEEIALAKARADTRQWLASKWNRTQYGADTAQINVNTNITSADAHLAALVARKQIQAKTQPMLPPAEADYEVVSE